MKFKRTTCRKSNYRQFRKKNTHTKTTKNDYVARNTKSIEHSVDYLIKNSHNVKWQKRQTVYLHISYNNFHFITAVQCAVVLCVCVCVSFCVSLYYYSRFICFSYRFKRSKYVIKRPPRDIESSKISQEKRNNSLTLIDTWQSTTTKQNYKNVINSIDLLFSWVIRE